MMRQRLLIQTSELVYAKETDKRAVVLLLSSFALFISLFFFSARQVGKLQTKVARDRFIRADGFPAKKEIQILQLDQCHRRTIYTLTPALSHA